MGATGVTAVCDLALPLWREGLRIAADMGVLAAVVVGGIALLWQAGDRRGQRAAVDASIRTLASQARRQLRQERSGVRVADLVGRIGRRGTLPADLLANFFTSIVAQAPHASPPIRRAASEVGELFWNTIARAEEQLARDGTITGDVATAFEGDFNRVDELLNRASTEPVSKGR
jgi:hypothetical protein